MKDLKNKYTEKELKKWYLARCWECGWKEISRDLRTDGYMGATGCCGDVYCPKCDDTDIEDYDVPVPVSVRLKIFWRTITFWAWRKTRKQRKAEEEWIREMEAKLKAQQQKL